MFGFTRKAPARPLPTSEFKEAYRLASERLRSAGKVGAVLVRLDIDEEGRVVSSRAANRSWLARFESGKVMLVDGKTGTQIPAPPSHAADPEVQRSAAEVAKKLQFAAARRGSRAVPHRGLRMTIAFE